MMKFDPKPRCLICIGISIIMAIHTASSATISTTVVGPSAQAQVIRSLTSPYIGVENGMTTGFTVNGDLYGTVSTGVIEFELQPLPAGHKINSAILDLQVLAAVYDDQQNYVMPWEVHGFSGNGRVDIIDAEKRYLLHGPFTATRSIGGVFTLTESGDPFPMNISLEVSPFLSDLYDSGASHVGFSLLPTAIPDSGSFSFNIKPTGWLNTKSGDPALTITSASIPEPESWLLCLGSMSLLVLRRHNTKLENKTEHRNRLR